MQQIFYILDTCVDGFRDIFSDYKIYFQTHQHKISIPKPQLTQLKFTSKSTIETLEKGVEYVQS